MKEQELQLRSQTVEASRGLGNHELHGFKACWVIRENPPSLLRLSQACHAGGAVVPIPPLFRAAPALHPAQTSRALTSPASVYTVQKCFISELQRDNGATVPVLVLDDTGEGRDFTSDPNSCKHPRSEPSRRHEPRLVQKGCGGARETLLLGDADSKHCQFLLLTW